MWNLRRSRTSRPERWVPGHASSASTTGGARRPARGSVLVLGLLLLACPPRSSGQAPEDRTRTALAEGILDAAPTAPVEWIGRRRPVPAPTRVVTLAPGLTETVFALGLGDRVVGTSRFADHPPEATRRAKVGGYTDLDVEAILALDPDLVVGIPGDAYRARLAIVADAGVPVVLLPGSSIADGLLTIETLGALLGAPEAGRALARGLERELLALARSAPLGPERPAVAVVYGWRPLFVAGPGSFPDQLLDLIGADNAIDEGGAWAQWSLEGLIARRPDRIVDATDGRPGPPPALAALPAVAEGRVYPAPHPGLMRPGPRLVEAARALARTLRAPPPTAAKSRAGPPPEIATSTRPGGRRPPEAARSAGGAAPAP